jgi:hypothetical protein
MSTENIQCAREMKRADASFYGLLIVSFLLCGGRPARAQCEVHENAKLTASDGAPGDWFGYSVSISGNVAVLGAFSKGCASGPECGSAYVYRFSPGAPGQWVNEQKLTASDGAAYDYFGLSVSVSGDTAFVGAGGDDCGPIPDADCGSAYVYRFNGTNWVQEQKLRALGGAGGDFFGGSVSVSGDVAVVGADLSDCASGIECGSAYVYRFDGTNWVQEQRLTASDAAAGDTFGHSVSVSGDAIVVGAYRDDCAAGGGSYCGSAYVYRFNGTNWVQEQKLPASDAPVSDYFGESVSVSGDTIVVGAQHGYCGAPIGRGSASVYRFNRSSWVEEQTLCPSDGAFDERFGFSVSVSGDTIVVGAYGDNYCGASFGCGSAYVYRFNGSGWVEQSKLTASDAAGTNYFGSSISVSGDLAVAGAPGAYCCGSAYVFSLAIADCDADGISDECDIASCAGDPACADCNANAIPDGCDIAACAGDSACGDCNANAVPDACDIADGTSADCNGNGLPDECEIAHCAPNDPSCQDCNGNNVLDECDIARGTSTDNDGNGVPDDCYPSPTADPSGVDTNRYLSFSLPTATVGSGPLTALRVTMVELQHPDPPTYRGVDFTTFDTAINGSCSGGRNPGAYCDSDADCRICAALFYQRCTSDAECGNLFVCPPGGTCSNMVGCTATGEANGCARWVGKPGTFLESQESPGLGSFRGARMQCTPYYHDWSSEGLIHVTGTEIVPSSNYDVQTLASSCMDHESTCTAISTPLRINTARWGDIITPFQSPGGSAFWQPDAVDVADLVNKFKNVSGSPRKYVAQLQPNLVDLNGDINALDIVGAMDAFKGYAYPFTGPCPCPSAVTCGSISCPSGPAVCVTAFGVGSMCVKTCTGGSNDGEPCNTNSHCSAGGTCGDPFCRDRCGRCTP